MHHFLGEYELRIDAKNRISLPAALKKTLGEIDRFVINRSFDKCLNFYPFEVWEEVEAELNKLNPFVKKERDFVRFVRGGATEVTLDAQGRITLPKRLLSYANISSDLILLGNGSLLEMWDLVTYEAMLNIDPEEFSSLAEEVMVKVVEEEAVPQFDENIIVPILRR